jgi:hypothetical protein
LNGDVECLPAKRVPNIEKILKQLYLLYKSTSKVYSNEFDKHPESHDSIIDRSSLSPPETVTNLGTASHRSY